MNYSERGMGLTRSFEGCRFRAYRDGGGVLTIAYGHTKGVREGQECNMEQAVAWLRADVQEAVDAVNRLVKVALTQNRFDALVDFVFNLGAGAFAGSTLLRLLNAGDYEGAQKQFARWNKDNGKVVAGLTRRRAAEANMFGEK
jgi:lysozyme